MADSADLVWANGRPMERKPLDEPIAAPSVTGVRSIHSGNPERNLTPARLGSILKEAEQGNPIAYLELAEAMEEKDNHYLSVLGTRKRQVSQLPIRVEPADESAAAKAHAALIELWL